MAEKAFKFIPIHTSVADDDVLEQICVRHFAFLKNTSQLIHVGKVRLAAL